MTCIPSLYQNYIREFIYQNIELAGYNAARGDFDAEFENGMELFLNDIEVNERMYEIVNDGGNKRQAYNFDVFL